MRNKKFYDLEQATRYLACSVVMFDGKPCYVERVNYSSDGEGYMASFYPIADCGNKRVDRVKLDDKRIDMNPVPLGFLSIDAEDDPVRWYHSVYVSRIPARRFSIGLSLHNVSLLPAGGRNAKHWKDDPGYARDRVIFSRPLHNTIMNRYPSIKRAFELADTGRVIAISRRFAINKDGELYYKSLSTVGTIDSNNNYKLDEECAFLQQALDEDLK